MMSTPIAIAQVDFKSLASKLLSLDAKKAEMKENFCMKVVLSYIPGNFITNHNCLPKLLYAFPS